MSETTKSAKKKGPKKPRAKKATGARKPASTKKAPAAKKTAAATEDETPEETNSSKPGFVGFKEPPVRPMPDSPQWPKRLEVLADHYRGEWVQYGPFTSEGMAKSSGTTGLKNATKMDLSIESEVHVEDDGAFLYVKVL